MAALRDIVDEGVLGASNHVALALPLIADIAADAPAGGLPAALETAAFVAETRGAGAPIVANALRWQTEGVGVDGGCAGAALLRERAERWREEAAARRAELVRRAAERLADCPAPLLFDYSSTVADVVKAMAAAGRLERLVIPESRAVDGGRRYLEALADLDAPRHFVPDAAMEHAASRSTGVLLGAESVTADGGVVNTVGSLPAARAAAARGLPVFGVADLFKVGRETAEAFAPRPERTYPAILPEGFEAVSTAAPELELVPPALVTALLTERGALRPAELSGALGR
jgi:translation initiation factor 2B subunit (eIF-2B alpha/beta/delta family)